MGEQFSSKLGTVQKPHFRPKALSLSADSCIFFFIHVTKQIPTLASSEAVTQL